ncbi:MAG TPA: penicillin acylase family protein [Candidatus Binatia bacterium]|nr:penicillin acylase family protein [Candidatus Binatia bacterium]
MPSRPGLRWLLRVLGRRLPRTRGVIRVSGLSAQVLISRDRWGIPHIDAVTDADAWYALGFCHGQDRGCQLELLVRAGRGTLSELVGPGAVPIDRLSRTLGLQRLAIAQLPLLDPDVRGGITAYVAGVNAAADATPRPHELALLRASRSAWTAHDVLAFRGLQSLVLAGNWDTELARLQILLADGPDALRAVDPTYGAWLPAVTPVGAAAGPAIGRLAADLDLLRELVGGGGASNAWAVAGSRTARGAPILANDPHLAPSVPGPWYLAHLKTPDWAVGGASFIGGPAFPTGHNGHLAWGITAGCSDAADLFWEEIDPDSGMARGPDGPEPVERIREEIAVRGGEPVVEEVLVTARGPVITPLLDGISAALSLRATWLEPAPVRGFFGIHHAREIGDVRDGFRAWPGPALNVVVASAGGQIGWQLVGTLPRRRTGNGTLPTPAWSAGWETDHLPFDDLPWCVDPDAGFVVSANNAPRADTEAAPFLGVDWLDGYRAARLVEALAARDDWDVATSAELQTDVRSVPWRDLREIVLAAPVADDRARTARELLEAWDGLVAAGSAAASVYELFVAELANALARRGAPTSWRWSLGAGSGEATPRTSFGARSLSQLVATLRAGDHAAEIGAALGSAVETLRAAAGADPTGWAWGRLRPLRLLHPLGGRAPFDRLFNLGPYPLGGDANTVAQAGVRPLDPTANPAAIANQRTVIDLGDVERSRYVLAGGQSGNPLSPRYADLLALWERGEGVPIAWSHDAIVAATVERLLLRPAGE